MYDHLTDAERSADARELRRALDGARAWAAAWKRAAKAERENARVLDFAARSHAAYEMETAEELGRVTAERDALRAAVEAVEEWVTLESPKPFGSQYHGCPWCKQCVNDGHAADCQRQRALGLGSSEGEQ